MIGTEHYDCIVVGAGISGLAYAWRARQARKRVLVLESARQVGGVLRTQSREGFRIERAATSVPSTATELLSLLDSLPEPPELVPAREAANAQFFANRSGLQAVPRTPMAFLQSRRIPWNAKVRALSEVTRRRRRAADHAERGETAYAFVRRRFGVYIAERFLRPFTNGIYGTAPERLGAADAFPRLVAGEARRGSVLRAIASKRKNPRAVLLPQGGMASIPRALGNALGNAVHCNRPVETIVPGSMDQPAVVWTADGQRFEADEVALAITANRQASLLAPHSTVMAQTLASVDYTPMAVVSVGYAHSNGPRPPEAFGFLRGTAKLRILGATFNSRLSEQVAPPEHELLTVYLGGSEDRAAVARDDEWIRKRVVRDLGDVFGQPIRPSLVDIERYPRAIPILSPGHRGRMAAMAAPLGAARIRLLGSHITGVALNDCVRC